MVQSYVLSLREKGSAIDMSIVIAAARGIVKSLQRSQLVEYGGPVELQQSWARSLLKRMNFTKRKGTTKTKLPPEEFNKVKKQFLEDIIDVVSMEEIPPELVLNWDQTGVNLVPSSSWTMALKGSKRVEIKAMNDKRQITCVFCVSLYGDFLPIQVIYGGKTNRCHPPYSFPEDWLISHSTNHWSNEATMIEYIEGIIVPYVAKTREHLSLNDDHPALAIFDHFKGQLTEKVTEVLEDNNIHSVLVPPGCTDHLQPLDVSVNKSAKCFLRREFQRWYCDEVTGQMLETDSDELQPVDLSTARMKCLGAQWLVKMTEYLSDSPDIIVNGFIGSGISASIDAGKPVIEEDKETDNNKSDTDEISIFSSNDEMN